MIGSFAEGQVISRNDKGEVVVTYKDGSWRYFMASDSILLVEEYQTFVREERQPASQEVKEPVQEEEIVPSPENSVQDPIPEATDNESTTIEDLPNETIVFDESQFTENEQKILDLTERRLTLTERLRRVESGYIQLTEKEIRKVRTELAEINNELNVLSGTQQAGQESIGIPSYGYNRDDYIFKLNDREQIETNCNVAVERDEFTKRKVAKVAREFFYQYTPDEMRIHLKDGHFLEAYSSLTQTNGNTILTINTVINSRSPQSGYGILDKGARIKIKFLNGDVISLFNSIRDEGRRDMVQHKYYYTGRYVIDKDAMKALSRNDIDTIRITWSTGYEDYEIYQVNLLKKQLACLDQAL